MPKTLSSKILGFCLVWPLQLSCELALGCYKLSYGKGSLWPLSERKLRPSVQQPGGPESCQQPLRRLKQTLLSLELLVAPAVAPTARGPGAGRLSVNTYDAGSTETEIMSVLHPVSV